MSEPRSSTSSGVTAGQETLERFAADEPAAAALDGRQFAGADHVFDQFAADAKGFRDFLDAECQPPEPAEQRLVLRYQAYMKAKGIVVERKRYRPAGEVRPIYCDAWVEERQALIEAKNSNSRDALRMAIGQLYDYRRLHQPVPTLLAILLPDKPAAERLSLLQSASVEALMSDDFLEYRRERIRSVGAKRLAVPGWGACKSLCKDDAHMRWTDFGRDDNGNRTRSGYHCAPPAGMPLDGRLTYWFEWVAANE